MRLFSYIIVSDTGVAPNPFFGYCTLACCKPVIRKTADVGDWIAGLTPKSQGNKLVYAMKVKEKLTFEEYWTDPRFERKKPRFTGNNKKYKVGDNIYKPLRKGTCRQIESRHSDGKSENSDKKKQDLGGQYVLVAREFVYFGSSTINLPSRFKCLIVGRGHKCSFPDKTIRAFDRWISKFKNGIHAPPSRLKDVNLPCGNSKCRIGCGKKI